jgi:excisionase family DNA binding protein
MPEPDLLVEPLLDAREAAKLLHVPRSTLYELVRSRGLPHVKVGQRGLMFTRTTSPDGSARTASAA